MSNSLIVESPEELKAKYHRQFHGRRFMPEYYSWYSMKTRCGNPNHADYPNWGGRGITYCARWQYFAAFYEDMGPRPTEGKYTLERVDNNKGYYKENCKWIPKSKQCSNQRNTKLSYDDAIAIRYIYADGGATQRQLAKDYNVSTTLIGAIIRNRTWKEEVHGF